MLRNRIVIGLAMLAMGGAAFAVTFTGDVPTDFAGSGYAEVIDGSGDVGLPGNAPAGTVSGWDIDRSLFVLDLDADMLSVGIDFFGIAGDADGDGGQGTSTGWVLGNGGVDLPNLAMTESICIAFDFTGDDTWDVIAGVSSEGNAFAVTGYTPAALGISFSFDESNPLPYDGGHAYGNDFELALTNISSLVDIVDNTACFSFLVFAGSLQDDGIGEDFQSGTVCVTDDTVVDVMLPTSFNTLAAYPNPFNPATSLSLNLAETGMVDLAVYNLMGQKVQTLVNGMMESGSHTVHFNGANLPSGLYLARLATEQDVQVERLLLSK